MAMIQSPVKEWKSTSFTPELFQQMIDNLVDGATRSAAAEAAGINRDTFYRWMHSSHDIYDAVTRAEAQAELRATQAVKTAISGYKSRKVTVRDTKDGPQTTVEESDEFRPDMATWWLERRRRDDYGQRLDVRNMPDDVFNRILEAVSGNRGALTPQQYPSVPQTLLTSAPIIEVKEQTSEPAGSDGRESD